MSSDHLFDGLSSVWRLSGCSPRYSFCPPAGSIDRSTDHCSAHPASPAGLGSPHAVSQTLQIHFSQSNLAQSSACCHRRGRCALLPAPWLRLARDPNRRRRRFGGWPHPRSLYPYTATRKTSSSEPVARSSAKARSSHWPRSPNSFLASSAFWRSTSMWSNGDPGFMVRTPPVMTTTEPRPEISTGSRRQGSPRFCRLP